MEAWQLLQLSVCRDVEARRVLAPRGTKALGNGITVVDSSVEQERLLAGFRGSQIVWHRLGSARGRDMLEPGGQYQIGLGGAEHHLRRG